MHETARAISSITSYTALISEPQYKEIIIKHIQLLPLDENNIILVVITNNKLVKNYTIRTENNHSKEDLSEMSYILNNIFEDKSVLDVDINLLKRELNKIGRVGGLLLDLLDSIIEAVLSETDLEIYTTGANNILTFPEFSDLSKAKSVFKALEEKDILITLLGRDHTEELKVFIGKENTIEQMKDCSVIRAGYRIGDHLYANIGIIGPTRMDYSQVIAVLNEIDKNLSLALRSLRGG